MLLKFSYDTLSVSIIISTLHTVQNGTTKRHAKLSEGASYLLYVV